MSQDWANIVKSIIEMKPGKIFIYIMEPYTKDEQLKFLRDIRLILSLLIMENSQKYF